MDDGSRAALQSNESFVEKYKKRIDSWDKKTEGFSFVMGISPDYLSQIAINGSKIGNRQVRIDATKIKTIKKTHPEMNIDIIKQLPELLNDPILVLDSNTVKGRLVLLGEVYAKGKPVMMALEINPTARSGKTNYVDVIKVASAYTRSNTQNMINASTIRYVCENKNRVNDWLKVNRLQLPLPNSQSDSANNSIPDSAEKSNSFDKKTSKDFKNSAESGKNVDDGSRKALKKSDKEYRDKVKAKADERVAKATAKAEARADRTIETKSAQLKAEYTTDKVFSQNSVKSGFESVSEVKKLPGKERETIARDLWLELEASDSQDVRDTFILKYSVKLYDAIKNADYKAYENMTMKEKDALREKLNATVKKIVSSGRKSKGAKIREDIKAEEQVAGEIKAKIYQSLKKIEDVKKERFLAASAYKSDEFKDTLEQLTKIDWRGKFSANIARAQVKKLSGWYSEENPIVEKAKPEIEIKNKKAETAGQTRLNQPSIISIPYSAKKAIVLMKILQKAYG